MVFKCNLIIKQAKITIKLIQPYLIVKKFLYGSEIIGESSGLSLRRL